MIKATVKWVLDSKPLSNGNHAVYLQIIKGRKRKKISIGLQCQEKNFVNEVFTKQHPNSQLENEILLKFKGRALEIIREFQVKQLDFTLEEFKALFKDVKKDQEIKVVDFFDEIIDEMTRSGRISNAQAYKDTKDSLIKFIGGYTN